MEENGYGHIRDEQAYRHLVIALLADFCHFVYEALRCIPRKLTVTYNLLRKPLRDNLLYLEWMLADRNDFMNRFRQGGDAIDTARLNREQKLTIIRGRDGKGAARGMAGPRLPVYELR